MYDNNMCDLNTSLGNTEDNFNKLSLSSELSKMKKKHMKLNSLIHIFSHKAQYNVEHIAKKSFSTNMQTQYNTEMEPTSAIFLTTYNPKMYKKQNIQNIKLNRVLIKNKEKYSSDDRKSNLIYHSLDNRKLPFMNFLLSSPEKRENTHKKLQELNEREKIKRALNAQKIKEKNKVLKENIIILRAKTMNENIQRKVLVETQKKIQKNSIESYKIFKKIHINRMLSSELKKEMKIINKKEKELIFWKSAYDKKLHEKDKNKSCNIRNLMLN